MSTCMAWTPVYDGNGMQVAGQDPNSYTTDYSCSTCRKRWTVTRRSADISVSEHPS